MNQEQSSGIILVMSGPSGVGKSTVFHALYELTKHLHFSVSCTTRPPRPGEEDGVAYHFLNEAQYQAHLAAGDFLEHATVHAHLYGTLVSELEPIWDGKDVLLDIDVQGMLQVRQNLAAKPQYASRLVTVFLMPPSMAELEKRLRGRKTEDEDTIQRRLAGAQREITFWKEYQYVLINEDSQESARHLASILDAARFRSNILTQETWNA